MIFINSVKKYCKNYKDIENYELALNDKVNKWVCHHRLELHPDYSIRYTHIDLIKLDLYYNRPANELIFVKAAEHYRMHNNLNSKKGQSSPFKGKSLTADAKLRLSESHKGLRNAIGHEVSKEQRDKHSKLLKGRTWKVINGRRVWL